MSAAYCTDFMAFDVLPLPLSHKNFTAISLQRQLTPATPRLLLPSAQTVPPTCVP
jgi:hypothetical protein